MIPSDLAARLRLMNDSLVQPLAPVREVSSDLPEFQVGQRFVARVEAALPDGTFRAIVAGKGLTLALPQSAKPGDTLDLVVISRTQRLVVAGRAENAEPASPPAAVLSRAGQIISTLLARGDGTAQTAQLQRAAPLLPRPPSSAAPLAPALQQAITESGLFYEAHQSQWIAGRLPLESLLREPQGRHSRTPTPPSATLAAAATQAAEASSGAAPARTPEAPAQAAATVTLPADLQPLVQQQLDAAATQQIAWRGEIWPGQTMQWEIQEEPSRQQGEAEEPATQWSTTVRLVLPQLGELSAALRLAAAGVSVELAAAGGAGVEALRNGQAALADALAAAGVPLLAMKVEQNEAE